MSIHYSLKDLPLDPDEINALKQAVLLLKGVDSFSLFKDLDMIIGKLQNRIHTNIPENRTIVRFENHTSAKGSEWYNDLFEAVKNKTSLKIVYKAFSDTEAREFVVSPNLLKEYRNRWFLICRSGDSSRLLTLGLDRISIVKVSQSSFLENDLFDISTHYDKVIGVSMDYNKSPETILLRILPISVPHVESKPIHKEQQLVRKEDDGSIIVKLHLMINYELKSIILGLGDGAEVLEPKELRMEIMEVHKRSLEKYSL